LLPVLGQVCLFWLTTLLLRVVLRGGAQIPQVLGVLVVVAQADIGQTLTKHLV
jgi:hypothetical protein